MDRRNVHQEDCPCKRLRNRFSQIIDGDIQFVSNCTCQQVRLSSSGIARRRLGNTPEYAFFISEDESSNTVSVSDHSRGSLNRNNDNTDSSGLEVVYLGTIKASVGMETLKKLAVQIAAESSQKYTMVDQCDLGPIERALNCEIRKPVSSGNRAHDLRNNFSMKVYIQKDGNESDDSVPITISGMELIKFLLGDCPRFFTTSLSTIQPEQVTHFDYANARKSAKKMLASVRAERARVRKANFPHSEYVRILIRKRRWMKSRPFIKDLRIPRDGAFPKLTNLPITTLNVYKGNLFTTDVSGNLITFNIATHKVHRPCTRQISSESVQSVLIAPYSRFGICIYLASLDGTLKIVRARTGCIKAEIWIGTPIHSMYTRFSHIFIGLSSGEIIVFHKKQMTIACVVHLCDSIIASMVGRPLYGSQNRRFLFAGAYDGKIYKIDIDNLSARFNEAEATPIRCEPEILLGHSKAPRSLIIEKDRPYLYSCSADGIVLVHNAETNEIIHRVRFDCSVSSVSLNTPENLISISTMDGTIRLFALNTFDLVTEIYSNNQEIMCTRIKDGLLYYATGFGQTFAINIRNRNIECKFGNCTCKFVSAKDLSTHLSRIHFPSTRKVLRCLWDGCHEWVRVKDYEEHIKSHATQLPCTRMHL